MQKDQQDNRAYIERLDPLNRDRLCVLTLSIDVEASIASACHLIEQIPDKTITTFIKKPHINKTLAINSLTEVLFQREVENQLKTESSSFIGQKQVTHKKAEEQICQ